MARSPGLRVLLRVRPDDSAGAVCVVVVPLAYFVAISREYLVEVEKKNAVSEKVSKVSRVSEVSSTPLTL